MTDLSKINVRNINVAVKYDSRKRISFCWKYFGSLVVKETNKKKIVNPDQVYCLACLNAVKSDSEDVTFGSVKIKSYNKTVSTGNLARHLRYDHQIQDDYVDSHKSKSNMVDFLSGSRNAKTNSLTKHDKDLLAKDLALWFCKSLLPFDSVSDEGMLDFFKKYNIVFNEDDLPSRYTVSCTALDDVYNCMLSNLKDEICFDAAQNLAISFDFWTDPYRRLNYITFTLHYLTSDFDLKYFTLSTQLVEGNKTRVKIEEMIQNIRNNFGLNDKRIHVVTGVGGNVTRAVPLTNMDQHLCLGHGLHNLVTVDGIKGVPEIETLVKKCKKIIKAVRYHLPAQIKFLCGLDSVIQTLEGDENDPILENILTDTDICEEDEENWSSVSGHFAAPTRWHSLLEMLESISHFCNRDPINNILRKIGQDELKITLTEWNLLENLVNFLKRFREAVDVMSSQKTCTMNVALLFRSEIIDVLNSVSYEESLIMFRLTRNMLANIDKRFPVTKAVVAAALLDNRFMNLKEVDSYMESKNMTKTSFLASYIKEVMPNLNVAEAYESMEPIASTSSNDTSLLHKLSIKHRVNACEDDPVDQECWRYVASADPTAPKDGDLLSFWNKNKNVFPLLAALAKTLLCVPATSIPSERVFSSAGLIISAKRSRLNPVRVNKVIFVHDNYKKRKTIIHIKLEK